MHRSVRRTLFVGAIVLLTLGSTGRAGGARSAEQTDDLAAPRHCVVEAQPANRSVPAGTGLPTCFGSFAAAMRFATDGPPGLPVDVGSVSQVRLDAGQGGTEPLMVHPEGGLSPTGSGLMVIGIEYQDSGFGGSAWIITASSGCADGGTEVWTKPDLLPGEWNNAISSARSYASCRSRHFESADFTGSSHLCGCASMGALNDRTSSIRWSRTGA